MRYELGTLAIKRQEPLRPDIKNNENKKGNRKTNANDFPDQWDHFIIFSLTNNIAYHTVRRGSKGPGEYAGQAKNISHGVGNSKVPGTVVLDQNIEVLPTNNADGVLQNQRGRLYQYQFDHRKIKCYRVEKSKSLMQSDHTDNKKNHQ